MIKLNKNKHNNKWVEIDGIKFQSIHEGNRYKQLKSMEDKGSIFNLRIQEPFVLAPSVILDGRKKPALRYFADFTYYDIAGIEIIEDAKSPATKKLPAYRMKKHLMMSIHGLTITEV